MSMTFAPPRDPVAGRFFLSRHKEHAARVDLGLDSSDQLGQLVEGSSR